MQYTTELTRIEEAIPGTVHVLDARIPDDAEAAWTTMSAARSVIELAQTLMVEHSA